MLAISPWVTVGSNHLPNYTRPTIKLVDGSGLGGDLLHDDEPYNFWEVIRPNSYTFLNFDLGASYQMDRIHVWNRTTQLEYNRMAKDVRIYYSTEDDINSFTLIDDFEFPKPVSALDPGFEISLASYDLPLIRKIRFEVISNYLGDMLELLAQDSANARVGISEVRFYELESTPTDLGGSYVLRASADSEFAGRVIYNGGTPSSQPGPFDSYNTLAGGQITPNKIWKFTAVPGEVDTYTIQSELNGLYMDSDDSDAFQGGYDDRYDDTVLLRAAQNDDSQKWIVKELSNGHWTIQSKADQQFQSGDFYFQKTVDGDSGYNIEWIAEPAEGGHIN